MPGLIRGVARTAVVAGTASAVSGRVQRRQAERYADRDAQIIARRQAAAAGRPEHPVPPPTGAAPAGDPIEQLKALAELKARGVLTEEEFAAETGRILAR